MCELIRILLFLTFSQFDVWKKSDYFLTEKRAEAFPMRVQNMFLYIRECTLKSKEAVKPLPRIFFVCFLGLRNNNIEMQRLENGRLHTHTHIYMHMYNNRRKQKVPYILYIFQIATLLKTSVYIYIYIYIYMYVCIKFKGRSW